MPWAKAQIVTILTCFKMFEMLRELRKAGERKEQPAIIAIKIRIRE